MHPFHILEDICKEHNVNLKLMAGANQNQTPFKIISENYPAVAWGSCSGSMVVLGISSKHRKEFDLYDPDSISDISEYLKSGKLWVK